MNLVRSIINRFLGPFRRIKHTYSQFRRKRKLHIKGKGIYIGHHINTIRIDEGTITCEGSCHIGEYSSFCFTKLEHYCPKIVFQEGVAIGKYNDFGCVNSIVLEKNVITAPFVHYSDHDHGFQDVSTPIMFQPLTVKKGIRIGEGSWIGYGAQIIGSVTIGRNCVIGAGAIVTKDVPDYCVVVGNPAKIVKRFNSETQKWETAL